MYDTQIDDPVTVDLDLDPYELDELVSSSFLEAVRVDRLRLQLLAPDKTDVLETA